MVPLRHHPLLFLRRMAQVVPLLNLPSNSLWSLFRLVVLFHQALICQVALAKLFHPHRRVVVMDSFQEWVH
jgi:hypothetical protein